MIALMIMVFYFFIIRPQSQQAKKEQAYRDSLKAGDKVMTAGGLHVTIESVKDSRARVSLAPGTVIEVAKTSLQPIPERKSNKK